MQFPTSGKHRRLLAQAEMETGHWQAADKVGTTDSSRGSYRFFGWISYVELWYIVNVERILPSIPWHLRFFLCRY